MGKDGELAAAVAHDLGEPLRVISHFASRLRAGECDPEMREAVDGIAAATERMEALLGSLRDYARAGAHRIERQPIELESVLDQALANLKVAIDEVQAEIEREPLPRASIDGIQVVRVFQNLLDNAFKFRRGPRPRVRVSAAREGASWIVTVRDDGIGFEPGAAQRIFELFERAHSDADRPGTGTGLAICARIIEQHGGRIWARSSPGEGATFSFSLPD